MALGACKGYEGIDRISGMDTKENLMIENNEINPELQFDSLGLFATDFWNNDLKRQDLAKALLNGEEPLQ